MAMQRLSLLTRFSSQISKNADKFSACYLIKKNGIQIIDDRPFSTCKIYDISKLKHVHKTSSISLSFHRYFCDQHKKLSSDDETVKLDDEFEAYIREIRKEFKEDISNNIVEDGDLNETEILDGFNDELVIRSSDDKFVEYDDYDAEIILDESEIHETLARGEPSSFLEQSKNMPAKLLNYNLQRGVDGVFDLEELVDILALEKTDNVCVLKVPDYLQYANYLILASVKSARHSKAVSEFLKKLHKKKRNKNDNFVRIEGENCSEWKALDFGNIVLHLFMPETREKYDLETLWSVGANFDDLTNEPDDPILESIKKHSVYLDDLQPIGNPANK